MDFVSDALFDGRRLRALTVADAFTRDALAIGVDQHQGRAGSRGAPKTIRVDNGPEFISQALDCWAHENGVTLDFSWPGKPTDNALVAFNGHLRDEYLTAHWSLSLAARAKIEAWQGTITKAVLTRRLAGLRLPPRPRSPPNGRRILTSAG